MYLLMVPHCRMRVCTRAYIDVNNSSNIVKQQHLDDGSVKAAAAASLANTMAECLHTHVMMLLLLLLCVYM